MRLLYKKLYKIPFCSKLSPMEEFTFKWWGQTLSDIKVRSCFPVKKQIDFLIYTDAAGDGGVAGVILERFIGEDGEGQVLYKACYSLLLPKEIQESFSSTSQIYAFELLAMCLTFKEAGSLLKGKSVMAFIDNNAALGALLKGDCANDLVAGMIFAFWSLVNKNQIKVWLDRVSSKANLADDPSRGKQVQGSEISSSPFTVTKDLWKEVCEKSLFEKALRPKGDKRGGALALS